MTSEQWRENLLKTNLQGQANAAYDIVADLAAFERELGFAQDAALNSLQRSERAEAALADLQNGGGCHAGKGRGDCEHFVGLPGKSIPGQHDGPDDTVDEYGKPNGWCWQCWKSHQLADCRAKLARIVEAAENLLRTDDRDEWDEEGRNQYLVRLSAALAAVKEVPRE